MNILRFSVATPPQCALQSDYNSTLEDANAGIILNNQPLSEKTSLYCTTPARIGNLVLFNMSVVIIPALLTTTNPLPSVTKEHLIILSVTGSKTCFIIIILI